MCSSDRSLFCPPAYFQSISFISVNFWQWTWKHWDIYTLTFTSLTEFFSITVMPCPFLTRLPSNFVKNYASPLMKQYVEQCPFLGNNRGIVSSVLSTSATTSDNTNLQDKCPFLKKVKSPAIIKKVAPQSKEIEGTYIKVHTCIWLFCFITTFFFS